MHSDLAPPPSKASLEVSEEERLAEYENRWASGGLSPYYAFTDSLLSMESNKTLADFARTKSGSGSMIPPLPKSSAPTTPS